MGDKYKNALPVGWQAVDWIYVTEVMDQWQAVVDTVVKRRLLWTL
jgi:hypothetical protein